MDHGEHRDDAHEGEERVRFCLACGQIVAYAQRTCPTCGHVEPVSLAEEGLRRAPCRACGRPKVERLLYCPHCGAEASPRRAPPAEPWREPPAGAVETLSVGLSLLAPALVLLALLRTVLAAASA